MPLDHVGIAVRSLSVAVPLWESMTGFTARPIEEVASQKVRVQFLPAGETELEFLEPVAPDSPVERFLSSRGEGIHHVALQVPNVDAALRSAAGRGLRLVDTVGRPGARGHRVGFVHPSGVHGVLLEFVEHA